AGHEDKTVRFYCLRIRTDGCRRVVSLDWLSHWSSYPQNKGGILTEATRKHKRHKKHKNDLSDALQAFDIQDAGDAFDGADHSVEMLHVKHFHSYFDMA